MYNGRNQLNLSGILRHIPTAMAILQGNGNYPEIGGRVKFYQLQNGVLTVAEVYGLPSSESNCEHPIFGFHIHEGGRCQGNATDFFGNAGMHYNPYGCPHPYHAGDMPPLFGVSGSAFSAFLTDRFTVGDIIGKTVIIHDSPDDFMTQPSGNAGNKIACGEIAPTGRSR
ncbi:MAG: superoxide dismutase family protein [Clostridia bacterium]|nr:superoxide dismutase family protein [Clostridia bacterium]